MESEVTTTYSYLYAGGKLLQETVTTGDTTETHNFFYDGRRSLRHADRRQHLLLRHQPARRRGSPCWMPAAAP